MNLGVKLAQPLTAGVLPGLLACAFCGPLPAAESVAGLFTEGKASAAFRYRLENVDQDAFAEDATASTLRTRLNFASGKWNGFGFFAEYDFILNIGPDDYNEGAGNTPDREQFPVVADPEGADLNQAYVQWQSEGGTLLRGGRERIIYDNARFIGNVGWRQNEQTYDALYFQHKAAGFDWQAAWVGRVNRIFGHDVPSGREDHDTWLLNGAKAWDGLGRLSLYYYEINNKDAAAASSRSYGLRFAGSMKTAYGSIGYGAEYATQDDAHNNPVNYSADYYRLDVSYTAGGFTPYLGYESLGGDASRSGAAFRTPLATLHAFNGWADKFLSTPNAGLNDFFLGAKGPIGSWSWNLVYHEFEAESGDASFGDEIDASLNRKFGEHVGLLLKAAWFDGDTAAPYDDTTKLWVQVTADF